MFYKNHTWEHLAEDRNSLLFRNYIWTKGFILYPELLGISQLIVGTAAKENELEYIGDSLTWKQCHNDLKENVLKDNNYLEWLIDQSEVLGKEFNQWTKENIFNVDVTKLSTEEIVFLLKEFIDKQSVLYAYGVAVPILDFQNFSFVEGNLTKYLKEKVPEKFNEYFAAFTEPIKNSFSLDQDEDLLKLIAEFYDDLLWREDVKNSSLFEIKEKYPVFYTRLQEHTKKHSWVYYVYHGPAYTEKEFLDFIKNSLDEDPINKLNKIRERRIKNERLKEKYLQELQPDEFNERILRLAGKVVWAKPRRKDYQSKSYFHLEKLLKEVAKRLSLSFKQVLSLPLDVMEKGLEKGEVDANIPNTVYKKHFCIPDYNGGVKILYGDEAEEFDQIVERKEETQDYSKIKEVEGSCACSGKAKGFVRIINLPSDMDKMEKGDILVSVSTTPSIVSAMKKASAIITDEGGLTCHASIVSREMEIPCVIGTKIATKVLKDGDLVEVDADKGIVRKPH
jgi:phosphohistidine swiveling domain-containing protein